MELQGRWTLPPYLRQLEDNMFRNKCLTLFVLASLLLAAFDDVERAGSAVAAIIAAGIVPGGLEMMDQAATRAVEAREEAMARPPAGSETSA